MRNLTAIATIFLLSISPVSAQTIFEENAQDVKCEWADTNGKSGKDICHITAQGTNMGVTMTTFRIGNRIPQYSVTDDGFATLTMDKGKTLWKGKSKQKWIPLKGTSAIQVIKLSDGMTVKLLRK